MYQPRLFDLEYMVIIEGEWKTFTTTRLNYQTALNLCCHDYSPQDVCKGCHLDATAHPFIKDLNPSAGDAYIKLCLKQFYYKVKPSWTIADLS